jgi:RNA polymerase sigma-70 factor, ECF subfamily
MLFDVGLFEPKPLLPQAALDPLIARVARGEHAAFVTLYRAHFGAVRAFAERLLGCSMAAEDLVHEVFLALPAALERFRGQCALRSYILSITVRSAKQHLRAAQRRRRLEAQASLPALSGSTDPPDVDRERRELAAELTRALDSLPLDQRAAFVLCEVEELSSGEAAEILGEKAGTVRARVFHAKRKLREQLEAVAPGAELSRLEVES